MKRTDLSQHFNNLKILAKLDTGANYLVTPIGRGHLESVYILKLSNEHRVLKSNPLNLDKVLVIEDMSDIGLGHWKSLYDYMLSMKKNYNCHFDFKINNMDDIAVAMVLPSGLILSVYYIKC